MNNSLTVQVWQTFRSNGHRHTNNSMWVRIVTQILLLYVSTWIFVVSYGVKAHLFTYIFTIRWTKQHTHSWHGYSFKLWCDSVVWHLMHSRMRYNMVDIMTQVYINVSFPLEIEQIQNCMQFGFNASRTLYKLRHTHTQPHKCSLFYFNILRNVVTSFLMAFLIWE